MLVFQHLHFWKKLNLSQGPIIVKKKKSTTFLFYYGKKKLYEFSRLDPFFGYYNLESRNILTETQNFEKIKRN